MLFVSLWQVINTTFSFADIAAGRGLAQPAASHDVPIPTCVDNVAKAAIIT